MNSVSIVETTGGRTNLKGKMLRFLWAMLCLKNMYVNPFSKIYSAKLLFNKNGKIFCYKSRVACTEKSLEW